MKRKTSVAETVVARGTDDLDLTLRAATKTGQLPSETLLRVPALRNRAGEGVRLAQASLSELETLPRLHMRGFSTSSSVPPAPSSEREPRMEQTVGLEELQVIKKLGVGGMGEVHLARQGSLRRDVAVKRLQENADGDAARLLIYEGRITGDLEHPNIIPIHALGRDRDDRPILVMKNVEGISWKTLLEDPSHPAWKRANRSFTERLEYHLEIMLAVCNAVLFAHSRGCIHRDIKPENVMIGRFGEVYLLDWGIALRLENRGSGLNSSSLDMGSGCKSAQTCDDEALARTEPGSRKAWACDRTPGLERTDPSLMSSLAETLNDNLSATDFGSSSPLARNHNDNLSATDSDGSNSWEQQLDGVEGERTVLATIPEDNPFQSESLLGTPAYIAPEMLLCDPSRLDERTDIYLLGATLHEVLTGEPRHAGEGLQEVLGKAYRSEPFTYDASVPQELAAICNKATHVDPAQRHRNVEEFRSELSAYLRHRLSHKLSAEADGKRLELNARLRADRSSSESENSDIERLFAECRFGYLLSLREWEGNPSARAGLQKCLESMLEEALKERRLHAAVHYLKELPELAPELSAQVETLRKELDQEAEEHNALRELRDQLDPSVALGHRILFSFAMGWVFLMASIVLVVAVKFGWLEPGERPGLALSAMALGALLVVQLIARKSLFQNLINVRINVFLLILMVSLLARRFITSFQSLTPPEISTGDMLLIAAMCGAAGAMLQTWFWLLSGLMLSGVLISMRWPESAQIVFLLLGSLSWFVAAIVWSRDSRRLSDKKG